MTWHPDIPPEYRNAIVTGDARMLAERIPDESIDLIFTDPVYDRIDDYEWLAQTAGRVLKPDSACLVWVDLYNEHAIRCVIETKLNYTWTMHWQRIARQKFYYSPAGITVVTHCLWFSKGQSKSRKRIADLAQSTAPAVSNHGWSKPFDVVSKWVGAFAAPDALILDPFTGGGTVPAVCKMLRRNYIAFEIDPATATAARERVQNTQPPLPIDMPTQGALL